MLCALNFKTGSARELGTGCVHIEGGQEVPGICKGERWRAEKMLVKRVLLVFLGVVLVVSSGGTRAWREVLGSTRGCGHGSYFGLGSGIDGYVDLNDFSIWMTHIRGAVTAVMTMILTIALMAIIAMIPMMAVIPMMAMFPMMAVPIMAMPLGMIHHITQQDQNIHNSLIWLEHRLEEVKVHVKRHQRKIEEISSALDMWEAKDDASVPMTQFGNIHVQLNQSHTNSTLHNRRSRLMRSLDRLVKERTRISKKIRQLANKDIISKTLDLRGGCTPFHDVLPDAHPHRDRDPEPEPEPEPDPEPDPEPEPEPHLDRDPHLDQSTKTIQTPNQTGWGVYLSVDCMRQYYFNTLTGESIWKSMSSGEHFDQHEHGEHGEHGEHDEHGEHGEHGNHVKHAKQGEYGEHGKYAEPVFGKPCPPENEHILKHSKLAQSLRREISPPRLDIKAAAARTRQYQRIKFDPEFRETFLDQVRLEDGDLFREG